MRAIGTRSLGSLGGDRGVAYVEVLLAFVPILMLFLGIVQVAILYSARLVVEHAARRAARSATVVLDDEERLYHGEPRNQLTGAPLSSGQLAQAAERQRGGGGAPLGLSRRATIEAAAGLVLLPLATRGGDSVATAIAQADLDAAARSTVDAMELAVLSESAVRIRALGERQPFSVQLRYRFPCDVPVMGRVACPDGHSELVATSAAFNAGAPYPYLD